MLATYSVLVGACQDPAARGHDCVSAPAAVPELVLVVVDGGGGDVVVAVAAVVLQLPRQPLPGAHWWPPTGATAAPVQISMPLLVKSLQVHGANPFGRDRLVGSGAGGEGQAAACQPGVVDDPFQEVRNGR